MLTGNQWAIVTPNYRQSDGLKSWKWAKSTMKPTSQSITPWTRQGPCIATCFLQDFLFEQTTVFGQQMATHRNDSQQFQRFWPTLYYGDRGVNHGVNFMLVHPEKLSSLGGVLKRLLANFKRAEQFREPNLTPPRLTGWFYWKMPIQDKFNQLET